MGRVTDDQNTAIRDLIDYLGQVYPPPTAPPPPKSDPKPTAKILPFVKREQP
jgi:hypothetical protein